MSVFTAGGSHDSPTLARLVDSGEIDANSIITHKMIETHKLLVALRTQTPEGIRACEALLEESWAEIVQAFGDNAGRDAVAFVFGRTSPHARAMRDRIFAELQFVPDDPNADGGTLGVSRRLATTIVTGLRLPIRLPPEPTDNVDVIAVDGGCCLLRSAPMPHSSPAAIGRKDRPTN